MGLLDRLKDLGCRLRLIRAVPKEDRAPRKITPRVTSLKDLTTEVLQQDLGRLRDELSWSPDKVFAAANIRPGAWTVERLRDLLRAEPIRSMDRAAARQAALQALAAEGAKVGDLVQDARARDKALHEAEDRALALVQGRQDLRIRQREALERQIGQLREACNALEPANQEDQKALRQWQACKATYTKDMTWALGFLVENPSGFQAEPKKSSAG